MKLNEYLKICDVHLNRLQIADKVISKLFPLTDKKLETITNDDLAYLELFTNRLAKLQDVLSTKVFPLFLEYLGANQPQDTLLDRLNKLEKIGVIASTDRWKYLRDMRNSLSHDYPEASDFMAEMLNSYREAFEDFKNVLERIEAIIE